MGKNTMNAHKRSKKSWYRNATVKAVVFYVALLLLMEIGMITVRELWRHDQQVIQWLREVHPWAVVIISIVFIIFYSRSWLKHYRKPTDLLSDYLTDSPTIHFELRRENNNFRVHWVSKNAEHILGYSIDEIKAPHWWYKHLHPADRNSVVKRALRGVNQSEFINEYRFRHANGHYIWVRDQIQQDGSLGRRIKGSWINISSDINADDEQSLHSDETKLTVGLAELDENHRILQVDQDFADIIGMSISEVIGSPLEELVSPTQHHSMSRFSLDEHHTVVGRRNNSSRFKAQLTIKKSENSPQLIACLTDVSVVEKHRQALIQTAYFDELTGLPNLRNLHHNFSQMIDDLPPERLATLVIIDINKFHQINQRYGALIGDQTLNRVAQRLKAAMPFGSQLYSGHGDEFVVLVNNITEYIDVQLITDKLLAVFEEKFIINNDAQFHLTCSAGASIYPLDGYDSEQLLSQAHNAMLAARRANAPNAVIFQHHIAQTSHQQLQLGADVQSALARQQLEIFYQPVLDEKQRVTAAEALLRWHHPDFGLLEASEFLYHAEHSKALVDIGLWTLSSVAEQLTTWIEQQSPIQHVAINLSASELTPQFVALFNQLIDDSPHLRGKLSVELSEAALNEAEPTIKELIQQLATMGVGITIDDFGTGFASLNYLAEYPIDTVKIDRSFTRRVADSERTQKIISAIVKLADEVNVDVHAEGVEEPQQLELMLKLGCRKWQGHLIHPAKPVDELINLD